MSRLSLLSGSLFAACSLAVATSACAQSVRDFDIPAGALRDGLNTFAIQSDMQILFAADMVQGLTTPGLRGRYSPQVAIATLLEGSGLSWAETRPGVMVIRRAPVSGPVSEATTLDDVLVTGTLLKRSGELASPVITLDRAELDSRGLGSVAEVLSALPQNYAGTATPIVQLTGSERGGSNTVMSTGINLRGLGTASTLVLVNGRRMAGTGFRGEFADISALPSAAVERVDVLLDGASSLYGSDAVAGVVNIVLRRSFEGSETRARVSAVQGGAEDITVSQITGRSWSSGSAFLSWEYQRMNALSSLDRPYTADGNLRPFGGSDRRNLFSAPGNIVAFDTATASFVSRFAIRPNPSGTAQGLEDFAAGETNWQAPSLGVDLLPDLQRHSVFARLRQSIGSRLDLSADLRYSRRTHEFAGAASVGLLTVTRNNPFFVSPTGSASHQIAYGFLNDLGNAKRSGRSESLGLSAGGSFDMGSGWSADGYLTLAQERGAVRTVDRLHTRFLNEALGTTPDDPATPFRAAVDGFFNPYGSGRANSRAVLDFISQGYTRIDDRSRHTSANLLLAGPLFSLPGGTVDFAFGGQVRDERFDTRSDIFGTTPAPVILVAPQRGRTIRAVFAEARVPIVGPDMAVPGIRSLEVSVAGRVEDYEDFGSTTNPKIGLSWSPLEALAVRASWGSSFRAPNLEQSRAPSLASTTFLNRADGSRALALFLTGGNADLSPETADTFTAGIDYRPRSGASLSFNVFDTRFTDRIAQPVTENLAGALVDPSLVPFVTLISPATNASDLERVEVWTRRPDFVNSGLFAPTSFGAIVDARWVNTGDVRVRGLDLSGRYPFDLDRGRLVLDGSASYILDYETRPTPTAPVRKVVGLIGFPVSLKSRIGATWTQGELGLSAHWNHVPDYRDRLGSRIGAWNTIDTQASWTPLTMFPGVRLALSVQNLFDEDPPFVDSPTGFGFDPGQASLLGRVISLQLIRRW